MGFSNGVFASEQKFYQAFYEGQLQSRPNATFNAYEILPIPTVHFSGNIIEESRRRWGATIIGSETQIQAKTVYDHELVGESWPGDPSNRVPTWEYEKGLNPPDGVSRTVYDHSSTLNQLLAAVQKTIQIARESNLLTATLDCGPFVSPATFTRISSYLKGNRETYTVAAEAWTENVTELKDVKLTRFFFDRAFVPLVSDFLECNGVQVACHGQSLELNL